MPHYAKVNTGKVVDIIVAEPEFFENFVDTTPGEWIQTSYNTRGNVHYAPNSDTPSGGEPLRGNYAIIGGFYDHIHDVFYSGSPYPSWILNQETWLWNAPVPYPDDGKEYVWNEESKNWIEINANS